jgi:hypothetical protein
LKVITSKPRKRVKIFDEGQNWVCLNPSRELQSTDGAKNGREPQAKRTADATEVAVEKPDAVALQHLKGDSPEARKTWTSGDVEKDRSGI